MEVFSGLKKLEKLNMRVSEHERDAFERVRIRSGFESVSAWARQVLMGAASTTLRETGKPGVDVAVYIGSRQISMLADENGALPIDLGLPEDVVVEGQVVDPESCHAVIREGFDKLRERYDISNANVLVTGRILPATVRHLRDLVASAANITSVYTIEFSMANALGVGIDARRPEPQAMVSLDHDWLEFAEIVGAGLNRKRSLGWSVAGLSGDEVAVRLAQLTREFFGDAVIHLVANVSMPLSFKEKLGESKLFTIHQGVAPAIDGTRLALPFVRRM